jgi:hypothetical protein
MLPLRPHPRSAPPLPVGSMIVGSNDQYLVGTTHDHEASSFRHWCTRVFLLVGVVVGGLLTAGAPAFASTSSAASHSSPAVATASAGTQLESAAFTRATLGVPVTLDARVAPDLPSGVCQVPGIGDIGGVLGFCNAGTSGIIGDLNNICTPGVPNPEPAAGGINAMIAPPETAAGGNTLYDNYGVAGQFWAAQGLQCSDMTSLIGNNVAGMVFDASKAMDRVTITVYQAAAGDGILTWLRDAVDQLITALGNAIYFPYLAPVVLLGAMWLAWQGLVRKRATRAIEGTIWMVIAATAATCLILRPADFTGVGTSVSDGVTQVLNTAFAKLPASGNGNCLPVAAGDPQSVTANYDFTSGNGMVDQNANELWSVLVCKPWLYGELGSTAYATTAAGPQTVVNQYGRQLLYSQAIAVNENASSAQLISAKESTYEGIAAALKANDPAIYPLFQGNQWTTRLEIAFGSLFAAMVAGLLILLVALTLIVLKLGFLLLLVAGPFFLIIGTHPGFGRIIAIRWFEMLVGVLMKQVAIAITLSVLLYCYSLIMGTSDQVLPWALKILMIALVTVTVFIYRRPFQHLFSAVGYGTIGSQERAEYSLREAGSTFRDAIPGTRVVRWARRNPGQAVALAAGAVGGVAAGAGLAGAAAGSAATGGADAASAGAGAAAASGDAYASRLRTDVATTADGDGNGSASGNGTGSNGRRLAAPLNGAGARAKAIAEADGGATRPAPPLDLPSRSGNGSGGNGSGGNGSGGNGSAGNGSGASSGWFEGGRTGAAGRAGSGWSRGSGRNRPRPSSGDGRSAPPLSGSGSGSSGSGGNGSSSAGSGPAWPASGWSGQRRSRPVPRHDGEAKPEGGKSGDGNADAGGAARPFWLRPPKRDK